MEKLEKNNSSKIKVGNKYYIITRDKYGCFDIFSIKNNEKFATSISKDWIEETIVRYEDGTWCDICRGDGVIENDDETVICIECAN